MHRKVIVLAWKKPRLVLNWFRLAWANFQNTREIIYENQLHVNIAYNPVSLAY